MSNISNLPLQEMIAGVVRDATEKMAAHPDDWAAKEAIGQQKEAMCGSCKMAGEKCTCGPEKTAAIVDPDYIEKLASACDFLAGNITHIEVPNRGVLGNAIAKMAGEAVPAPNPAGSLPVEASMGGEQQYKKDKPKSGFDAAVSTAGTPEGTAGLPGGATQMLNNMESAPGQASGSVPTAKYPAAGPLHAGSSKTASKAEAALQALRSVGAKASAGASAVKDSASAGASRYKELMMGGKKMPFASAGKDGRAIGKIKDMRPGTVPSALLQRTGAGSEARKALGTSVGTAGVAGLGIRAVIGKEKSAGDKAREMILAKLAGEDVMKATISSGKGGGPLVGDGDLTVMDVTQHSASPTDGSGYGNQQRSLIASNSAASNYDKGQAKKPRAAELAEVLKNPAFSPKHDGKLQEQLQNTGKAGVKIAGAQMHEFLKQAAAEGKITQEMVNNIKVGMDGKGCTCGGEGTCKSCKLEALKSDAAKTSQMGGMGGAVSGMGGAASGGMGY